jgi:hypothetical protein
MSRIQQNCANLFSNERGPGIANKQRRAIQREQTLLEQSGLRAFAGAFGAIKYKECAATLIGSSITIRT